MSGTIETTNNNLITKINTIIDIIDVLNLDLEKYLCQINQLHDEYSLGAVNILASYFLLVSSIKKEKNLDNKTQLTDQKKEIYAKYQEYIRKENFISKMDRIMKKIDTIVLQNLKHINTIEYMQLKKIYYSTTISKKIHEVSYEVCHCSHKMIIDPKSSALICQSCGSEKELQGTVFEDSQFYYQEGQRTKHGTYDPSKHCRFWVERIQARETTEIPQKVIQAITKCIKRDRIKTKSRITCDQIRKYLRETGNTKYNEHVPLIRKIITGITPEQLLDYERQLINIYFDKAIRIFDEIKPDDKTNCPYHPYFIYKIIEQILKKQRIRKNKILSCIHLQSRETLIENDRSWEIICERIPEFTYVPTDRNARHTDY